jgi:hypothetical protein
MGRVFRLLMGMIELKFWVYRRSSSARLNFDMMISKTLRLHAKTWKTCQFLFGPFCLFYTFTHDSRTNTKKLSSVSLVILKASSTNKVCAIKGTRQLRQRAEVISGQIANHRCHFYSQSLLSLVLFLAMHYKNYQQEAQIVIRL